MDSGRTGGRTPQSGQKVLGADTQADADKQKVLFYKQRYPSATVRETGDAVGIGKTKAAEIIAQLKREGRLPQ